MSDTKISEAMQLKSNLTLNDRQSETINVLKHQKHIQRNKSQAPPIKPNILSHDKEKKSSYCGKKFHERNECPAKNTNCRGCGIKGHFLKMCRKKKTVNSVRVAHTDDT